MSERALLSGGGGPGRTATSASSASLFRDAVRSPAGGTAQILPEGGDLAAQRLELGRLGRLLAFLLSFYAFAVFGYVAAAFASFFVGSDRDAEQAPQAAEFEALRREVSALREDLRRAAGPPVDGVAEEGG